MSIRKNQTGFSAVELIVALVVVGGLIFAGYTVFNRQQPQESADTTTSQPVTVNDVPSAPEIKDTDDLDKASAALDQVEIDGDNDSSQLDSELATF